jgi:methionyl-tRNA formyltransferase
VSIVFAGTPENAAVTLRELVRSGTPISLVLTRPDAPVGRKGVITPSPVALVAMEEGIEVIKTNFLDSSSLKRLTDGPFEFAIVVAFGVILRKEALESLPKGWFNLHYSLLPKYRGAAPVQWALINGEAETGVSLFKIDVGLDTGPIVSTAKTQVQPDENAGELLGRLTHLGVSLLLESIPAIASGLHGLEAQDDARSTLAPKLGRTNGELLFSKPATEIYNTVRGVTPEPGAWTTFQGQIFKVLKARIASESLAPGTLLGSSGRALVGCQSGSLELIEVQPAGKNRMPASDWLRGLQGKTVKFGSDD